MQVTLIRHLPTEWNQKTWLQGKQDIPILPLTSDQEQKIKDNQLKLKRFPKADLILASTLMRTQQTAKTYGFKVETESLLNELDFGPYEGKPKNILIQDDSDQWLLHPKQSILGEQVADLERRIYLFIDKYSALDHVIVFGHGSWIRAFLSISKTGSINHMNQINVLNNQLIDVVLS